MVGVLFLAFAFLLTFILFSARTLKSLDRGRGILSGREASIGVVEVNGIILDAKRTIKHLMAAEEDESIKAIVIRINSPGGAVGPTQEIYAEIRRINEKKPVYASFAAIAASGGYYIGAAAKKIFANPGTLTGSIGVIMQFMNLEKLYQFLKLDPGAIKSGRYKDIGTSERKMSFEERQLMQKLLDGVHRQFISDILRVRKDRIKGDINDHAQGQIFSGQEAYDLGLVDELLGLYQAGRKIHRELKLDGEFGLKYFKHREGFSISNILDDLEGRVSGTVKKVFLDSFPLPMFLPSGW